MEPHCLWHAVPWSLDICTTKRSHAHRVQTHGASNRDTHLYQPHSTSVRHFLSYLYKWGTVSSAACGCGAEEQTVDHVVLQCPTHRPPHGLHGLTFVDDETIEWLLNTCPEIWCGQAVV